MDGTVFTNHVKILGKLAYAYNSASGEQTAQKTAMNAFFEQICAVAADNDNLVLFAPYVASWQNAINNGPANIQTLATSMAGSYFTNEVFATMSAPPTNNVASAVANALADEITDDGDKAFTTSGTLVGFLNASWDLASGVSWPTSAGAGATHADGTYVVTTEL